MRCGQRVKVDTIKALHEMVVKTKSLRRASKAHEYTHTHIHTASTCSHSASISDSHTQLITRASKPHPFYLSAMSPDVGGYRYPLGEDPDGVERGGG